MQVMWICYIVDIVVYTNQCIYNQQYILHTDCIYLYQIILRMLQTTYKEYN